MHGIHDCGRADRASNGRHSGVGRETHRAGSKRNSEAAERTESESLADRAWVIQLAIIKVTQEALHLIDFAASGAPRASVESAAMKSGSELCKKSVSLLFKKGKLSDL